jgi:hypothetical protein
MVMQQHKPPHPAARPVPSNERTRPTATAVEAARRVQAMHRKVCVPEPVCRWCLRSWPCPGDRWAGQVLQRLADAMRGSRHHGHH